MPDEANLTTVYVFFASAGDLAAEREGARDLVERLSRTILDLEWRIQPIFWEDSGPAYGRPQETMNWWLDRCHVFVGLLWRRWGTPTGQYSSGFEEEFERAMQRRRQSGRPEIWVYLKDVDQALRDDPGEQLKRVLEFEQRLENEELVFFRRFATPDEWLERLTEKLFHEVMRRMKASPPSAVQTAGQDQVSRSREPSSALEVLEPDAPSEN